MLGKIICTIPSGIEINDLCELADAIKVIANNSEQVIEVFAEGENLVVRQAE